MGRFGTWPITVRVAVATGVLMIVLGLVASQQVLSTLGRLQDERLREFARLHVEGLAVALGPFALHKDVWEIYDTLDRAQQNTSGGRILFTVVADEQGKVLAATDPLRAPVDADIGDFLSVAVPVGDVSAAEGAPVVRVFAPLSVQGRTVGQVVTELDVGDLIEERRKTTLALLAGNALTTVILVLAGYLLIARLLKPVELLASHMGEAGDAPHPIPETAIPRTDSVLSRLLRNYNGMVAAIGARAEAERRLAERERFVSLGRLSSSLAHEINNPLGGLLNAVDTVRTYADRPEVVRQSADLLDRGLRHLGDVSGAILDENRLDRTGRPLTATDFDDLRLLFEPETTRRGQHLGWDIAEVTGELPSAPLRQIALNLLLNAASAAPEGGSVLFRVRQEEGAVTLTVADDGPGLTRTARARLMSQAPVAQGGGVGLRLVHDLVAGLGGSISYDRSERMTEIRVSIPLREAVAC